MSEFNKFKTFSNEIQKDGSFIQQDNLFTKKFGHKLDEWPLEPNRYRLLWMPACPHSHKVVIVLKLLGLDKVISIGAAGPYRTEKGWVFSLDKDEKDPVLGIHYISDIYEAEDSNYKGRPTVPIIVDTITGKGVNNDNFNLTTYLETDWAPYHKENAPDLYPVELREEIDKLNKIIYNDINTGVYKVGFAHTQRAYERAYDKLFKNLDKFEERLENQRYLLGDRITDSDIRLYTTLARFDLVYYQIFRANRNRIVDYKNLWDYARDLHQTPGIGDTTDFEFIKESYHLSPHLKALFGNIHSLLPKGPDLSEWNKPHGRDRFYIK